MRNSDAARTRSDNGKGNDVGSCRTTRVNNLDMTRNQLLGWLLFSLLSFVAGYEVPVSDTDYSRQICSGMWSSQSTFINGIVFPGSVIFHTQVCLSYIR